MPRQSARKPLEIPAVLHPLMLLRLEQVLALVQIPKSTWYEGMTLGRYPLPVRTSARSVAWRAADIQKLLESFQTTKEIDPNIAKAIDAKAAKREAAKAELV
jgi:predicted DNA-binding transcriptional regulator AlpA